SWRLQQAQAGALPEVSSADDADDEFGVAAKEGGPAASGLVADPVAHVEVVRVERVALDAHELDLEAIHEQAGLDVDGADRIAGIGLHRDEVRKISAELPAAHFAIRGPVDGLDGHNEIQVAELPQPDVHADEDAPLRRGILEGRIVPGSSED